MGIWVEKLGPRSGIVASYYPIYGTLTIFILLSLLGLPLMHKLRKIEIASGKL
jgi:hypothetical protein